jgi:drug/metabolite transporter (DMT)-like permease
MILRMFGRSPLEKWLEKQPPVIKGAVWMTVSAFAYAASIAIVHHVVQELHFMQVVFLRNFFGLAFMAPWLVRVGLAALKTSRLHMHAIRGATSAINVWFLFAALWFAPVADTAAITFMMPIIASLFAVIFLREKTTALRWVAVALGFTGALIVIRPGLESFNLGLLFALGSAISGAAVAILIKTLVKHDSADTIAFYLFVSHTIFSLGPAIYFWTRPTIEQLLWGVALGYLGTLIQRNFNKAMGAADATIVLPFNFTRLIWAALFGWLFFSEFPDLWTWIGGILIFSASIWLTRMTAGLSRNH